MFEVKLNEQNQSIQIKYFDGNGVELSVAAEGRFVVDRATRIALVLIIHVTVSLDDYRRDEFLSSILSHVGQAYHVSVFLRSSIFDSQIDMDNLHFKNMDRNIMAVAISDVKCENNHIRFNQEHYALITNKEILLNHSQQLTTMINENDDFGAGEWNDDDTRRRISTASHVAMIIDKTKNVPCGIGRLLMIQSEDDDQEIFGYLSFIGIDRYHQRVGLGSVIVHSLMTNSINQNRTPHTNGLLCLICATEGVGGVAGPKLYNKFGFEFISKISNPMALFHSEEYRLHSH